MCKQAAERVLHSKLGPKTHLAEQAPNRSPQADQVITSVRAGAKHGVCCAQFLQSQPQHGGRKRRRVGSDNDHRGVLLEQFTEGSFKPGAQVSSCLSTELELVRDDLFRDLPVSNKEVVSGLSS